MQNLINELMQPRTDSNGEAVAVTNLNRRAAEAIAILFNKANLDTKGRLLAEEESSKLLLELVPLRDRDQLLLEAVSQYAQAMNEDYNASCT